MRSWTGTPHTPQLLAEYDGLGYLASGLLHPLGQVPRTCLRVPPPTINSVFLEGRVPEGWCRERFWSM